MNKKLKFHQIAIGEEFMIKGERAEKLESKRYVFLSGKHIGSTRGTTGTANVNQPDGDEKNRLAVKADHDKLNAIAKQAGFENWYRLERAALDGQTILIELKKGE